MARCKLFIMMAVLVSVLPAQAESSGLKPLPDLAKVWTAKDLSPLKKVIGNSRFVGLGESAHTTEDFSRAKLHIVKYMVEHLGFRALAFETGSGWRKSLITSKYVATCEGSATEALDGLADVWRSESIAELLSWLCRYNRAHPGDPVKFFSFDMQGQEFEDLEAIGIALRKLVPDNAQKLLSGLTTCVGYGKSRDELQEELRKIYRGEIRVSPAAYKQCVDGLERINEAVSDQNDQSSLSDLRIATVGFRASQDMLFSWRQEPRDRAMAALLELFHESLTPNAKTIVWAHNAHLAAHGTAVQSTACYEPQTPVWSAEKSMGQFFSEKHGRDYAPIALTAYDLSFYNFGIAKPWPVVQIPKPKSPGSQDTAFDSVEALLHSNHKTGNWFLDLSGNFLKRGATYTLENTACKDPMIPAQQFRAIISLEKAQAMKIVE